MKKSRFAVWGSAILLIILSAVISILLFRSNADYSGITLRVASSIDISAGSLAQGAQGFAEKYGCTVEFTDDFSECDLIYSPGEDFSACQPIGKYINPRSKRYTRQIISQNCTADGEIYGISHVLLGNISYCVYNPEQFSGITTPYEYFRKGRWRWDSFINMGKELGSNISVDWDKPYINMMYALAADKNGETVFNYGSQEQIEWLNFVRTLIYDEGIIGRSEGALKAGFLPQLTLDAINEGAELRYIPWPSKNGRTAPIFVDEYHFCVPKAAQNPKLSVMLADAMLDSCVEARTNLYKANMPPEDYKIFEKQLNKIYTFPPYSKDEYVPAQLFIDDFMHGKTVTEHIFNVENDALHIK